MVIWRKFNLWINLPAGGNVPAQVRTKCPGIKPDAETNILWITVKKLHSRVYRKRDSIVTVTAAGLLTAVDMWSERSAGGRPALWPCSPQAWPLCTLADVTYWSRLSCSVTACYPPLPLPSTSPPPPPPPPLQTQTHKLLLRCLLPCCGSSSSLHPLNLSSLGRRINGPRLLRPHQWLAPSSTYPLRPFLRGWWVYCFLGDCKWTAGERVESEGSCMSLVFEVTGEGREAAQWQ